MSNILVIAAHPDDEVLGCGGAMALHNNDGDEIHVLFMTDGVSSRGKDLTEISNRQFSAQNAGKILGVKSITFLDYPDNQMDSVPLLKIVQDIEKAFSTVKPNIIYTHHVGDLNIDHQITHKAVMIASRPQPGCCVREIYTFEILSSTEWNTQSSDSVFLPNYYVDISPVIDLKVKAMNMYEKEIRNFPHSRSIEGMMVLSKYRGSNMGMKNAEAFHIVRILKN